MPLTDEQRAHIALHRRIGMAEGLLKGWLRVDGKDQEHLDRCRKVTREFLEEPKQ